MICGMLSLISGPKLPLFEKTIDQTFKDTVERFSDRAALVSRHQNVRLTYGELDDQVEAVARGLAGISLRRFDRLGIWASNCLEWILLQLACARTGLVLVNVNPAYRSRELEYVLRKSRMRALVLPERDARADYAAILAESEVRPERAIFLNHPSWNEMIRDGKAFEPNPDSPDDVANIQYTSGTTGSPKGVLLTHKNLVNNAWLVGRTVRLTENDRVVVPFPFYHCAGCVIGSLMCFVAGASLVIPSLQFDARATLEAVAAEGATVLTGVPTMFIGELNDPELSRFDLTSLRAGFMGGSPCPVEVMKRVVSQMHCAGMTVVYGQTEASPVITMPHIDDSVEIRTSTIGTALPNTEVKIVSLTTGETLPVGEQGELCTRGYLVMKGYDDEPGATARAVDKEGWLHTGDLATMRPGGYINITGRSRDMIIRGGENIYPREIEEFLYTHPKIADVQIVGLPDLKLGETVSAWIRLRSGEAATEEEIRSFCDGKIAHFKIPQYIRFVDSFPMTVTGKVQKYKIREIEIQERGLQKAAQTPTA
jgi:fatty-acyl-CoA synthase